MILTAALIVALATAGAAWLLARELRLARDDARRSRALTLLALFGPAIEAGDRDPRVLTTWQPLARAARAICPEEFRDLDRAAGATFPFSVERLQAAHARWTADWLAWERTHDAEYKRRAAAAEQDLERGGAVARAALEAVEREKLDLYQRRYEEYVRVARALQALCDSVP